MAGLKIQVNGKGVIPRGYGLAPRKEPFMANDINFIYLILCTPGLSIKYVNPETNRLDDITKKNMKKIWEKYANYAPRDNNKSEQPAAPHVPDAAPVTPDKEHEPEQVKEFNYVPATDPQPEAAPDEESANGDEYSDDSTRNEESQPETAAETAENTENATEQAAPDKEHEQTSSSKQGGQITPVHPNKGGGKKNRNN